MHGGDLEVHGITFLYKTITSNVVALEKFIPQTFWIDVRKKNISILDETVPFSLKRIERVC